MSSCPPVLISYAFCDVIFLPGTLFIFYFNFLFLYCFDVGCRVKKTIVSVPGGFSSAFINSSKIVTVARQKNNESDEVSWGKLLQLVIIGEYNVAHCWPFSGIDAHSPHAINQTNISAHSCVAHTLCGSVV